ncbi:MAG TPA: hypothetical protein VLH09_00020, partial [Bryobacteraceae bacterium]|nr:hypothetical protein [Bryobacteraceae bacterium]
MLIRSLTLALLVAVCGLDCAEEKYGGPRPAKPDVPYLMHADNLVETEVVEAKQEDKGNNQINWIPGAGSPVRTPLAEPIFLVDAQKVVPEKLELYRFDVKRDRREIVFPKKQGRNSPRPLRLVIRPVEGKLFRIEAN